MTNREYNVYLHVSKHSSTTNNTKYLGYIKPLNNIKIFQYSMRYKLNLFLKK